MRIRLALWTPVPPQPSGIADYSLELLRQLVRWAEVEVFVDQGVVPAPEVTALAPVHPFFHFAQRDAARPFDAVLYQLGSSLQHLYMLDALRERPGIVTLHDLTWGALLHRVDDIWREEGFRRELLFSEGEAAAAEWDALWAGDPETLAGRVESFLEEHPLLGRLAAGSLAQIVHLPAAAAELRARYPAASVFAFPMGVEDPWRSLPPSGWEGLRPALGVREGSFLIGAFGIADPVKRLHVATRALARLAAEAPEIDPVLLVVGPFPDPEYRRVLERLAAELGVSGRLRLLGKVPMEEFERALLACDAVVNLRYPFRRQMSATLMRAVAAGKPVLISDVGDWSDLPAESCLRVPPEPLAAGEEESLAGHLLRLARDPALRREISEAARRFYLQEATPSRMADGYRRVLESVTGRQIPEPEDMEEARTTENAAEPAPEPSWATQVLAWMEELLGRWNALRGKGLGRLRNLGVALDLQRDLSRAMIDHHRSLEERLRRLESGLETLSRRLAGFERPRDIDESIAELRRGQADLLGAIHDLQTMGSPAALDSLREDLATLRDRQDVLRARQARVEIALAGSGAGEVSPAPLSAGDFDGLLAELDGQASAVEVSVQDARAEGLVFAAQRHFGSRLSADFRKPGDLWIHVDFTPRWDRPALLENAADRLVPGGRFALVTSTRTGEPARHPRLRLEEDRPVPLAGGGMVRVLAWRTQP